MSKSTFRKSEAPARTSGPDSVRVLAALDLVREVETTPRPADAVVSAFFKARRSLRDEDRGAILELLLAILRHRARLGWWLSRVGCDDTPRNRMLAWLALAEGQTADRLGWLLAGQTEHRLVQGMQGGALNHPEIPEELRLECPPWAAEPLRRRFGPEFARVMEATLEPPPLDLRVNPMKATRDVVLRDLKALGIKATPTPLSSLGVRIQSRLALTRLPGLKTGEIEIQDEGSQLVALLVDARPGEQVVDFCAGAGGKTLALAAQMMNRGHIVACDVNESRLKRCAERLKRAGLQNTETRLLDGVTDRWIKRHKGRFDRVLVDAPCSGTGTWRRNPDSRWRAPELGLEALVRLQAQILASAARLVRPGGRLVYATCSMLLEENEEQVSAFLAAHPDFQLVPLLQGMPDLAVAAGPEYLSLDPARHGTDGFFAAVLQRGSP